ncbi:MAG: YggS family pyridoxal phosphate-dependent enzyme [Candidatus Omnitrophica bacterium]|nr:YggS family pyridoxal phosphate-dependent enzyme [Candidatus Omnitrophota bacterium]MBU1047298.1 YggS family pyridoxal phosphate-dependent enzyme [Candidatus Omnitrophota bacterium]MBU1630221.1 YggS family pyridoxal phosphate-dependent enzyme [Candidatus Omnitrophota bacterium]MBU1767367.1 YggS family pyridoxal phosphate-dependent enzyme [Candidatus Omnitrophota bacterium]MBU1889117.1 YggS family pyridoxal phosphate-dependent enzyme [Candidatus Omnitrophota bacterium]
MSIKENYQKIRSEIGDNVMIIVAVKGRTKEEIEEVIDAGAQDLGENYVQEAESIYESLGDKVGKVRWHMIGHLQKNKINKALQIFDVIQTIDSKGIALALNERAKRIGKVVPVYIEMNIGDEMTKSGVKGEYEVVEGLAKEISKMEFLRLEGLMAMEPQFDNPQDSISCFKKAKDIFERIGALNLPNVDMKELSMGMSGSYKIAIQEGSNMVRLGSAIFGAR